MELYENKQKLRGFVGKDAERFATKNQSQLVVFTLATKPGYKDRQTQQWVNRTDWHRVVVYGNLADIAKDLKKGDYVEIEAEMQSKSRDLEVIKDNKKTKIKVTDWEARATKVTKLAKPKSSRAENLDAEPITEDDAA